MVLEEYLSRKDVKIFIGELETNPIFQSIKTYKESRYGKYIGRELALYTFYDTLLKYKIIIDDLELFNYFLDQIQKVYRKMNHYDDLVFGIHKIICSTVAMKLGVSSQSRNEIVSYIYKKYIVYGYYYHGFSTVYEKSIIERGFNVDSYYHFYSAINRINEIFSKYGVSHVIKKDLSSKKVYFTDDFIMGCHYSITSPHYFYKFLFNSEVFGKKIREESYLINNYSACISALKRYMSNNLFSEKDKNEVLKIVFDVWNYIHKVPRRISILMVKRSKLDHNFKSYLSDLLDSGDNTLEIVDRIFSPKNSNVVFSGNLSYDDFRIITLNDFYREKVVDNDIDVLDIEEPEKVSLSMKFLDTYGNASFLVILGSMMITLGVIITIISVLRGI